MNPIFDKFSATELDNVLHAINKHEYGDGFTADEIQTNIWLDDKIAPPVDDAIDAIINYRSDLVEVVKQGKSGKRFRPGTNLMQFLKAGGFKRIQEKQVSGDEKWTIEARTAAHEANLATINAAASAKRSADASEVSAEAAERSANAADQCARLAKLALIISIFAVLISLVALFQSFI